MDGVPFPDATYPTAARKQLQQRASRPSSSIVSVPIGFMQLKSRGHTPKLALLAPNPKFNDGSCAEVTDTRLEPCNNRPETEQRCLCGLLRCTCGNYTEEKSKQLCDLAQHNLNQRSIAAAQ